MASNAVAGVGTQFRRWNNDTSEFESIAEVNSISGPSMSRDTIDVTSLDSTGGYREYIPGFRDGGTISLTMNFTNTTFEIMQGDFEDEEEKYYEIVLPDTDTTTLEFRGIVTELPLEISPDDKITSSVTIKITGEVKVNKGSGSGSN
jgi:predicted secreted protein